MRRQLLYIVANLLVLAVAGRLVHAGEPQSFGKSATAAESVSLGELLASPDKYVNKTVRVTGTITDVCQHMGCWIDIAAAGSETIRFKVNDGDIVFPTKIKGKDVVAEGVFTRLELSQEEAIAQAKHEAEESGKPFDPASVSGPVVKYQIAGIGAVVR